MKLSINKLKSACLGMLVAVTLSACGGSGAGVNPSIAGVTGPDVEFVNGRIILSMTFQNINVDGGATIPIPKYPNSSLQVGPDFNSAGTLLTLTIAASDFLGAGAIGLDPQTLPGGRPLPSVAAGVMPALAIRVPQLFNTVFYVGPQVLGFFVPFKALNLAGSIISFRFNDKTGKNVGILSLVGSDASGNNAGILAMLNVNLMGILKPAAVVAAK